MQCKLVFPAQAGIPIHGFLLLPFLSLIFESNFCLKHFNASMLSGVCHFLTLDRRYTSCLVDCFNGWKLFLLSFFLMRVRLQQKSSYCTWCAWSLGYTDLLWQTKTIFTFSQRWNVIIHMQYHLPFPMTMRIPGYVLCCEDFMWCVIVSGNKCVGNN